MKLKRFNIIRFMLITSVLSPGIYIPGLFAVRPEEILAFALIPVLLSKLGKRLTWIDFCFILVGISTFISMVWGILIFGILISPRDLMEFVKIIKAWALFRLALCPWSDKELIGMAKTLLWCLLISAFVGVVEWQDWQGLKEILQSIYAVETGNEGTWRMIGTVGNSNYYGFLMAMGLALAVNLWNYNQRRSWRRRAMVLFGLCGMTLFLTHSRSAILASVLAICFSVFLRIPRLRYKSAWRMLRRVRWQLILIIALTIAASFWTWQQFQVVETLTSPKELSLYNQNPIRRSLYRLSKSREGLDIRMELMWRRNFPLIKQSPIFGWGPAKSTQSTVTDNGFLLTIRRYGFLGLLSFLLLYWQVSLVLFRVLRANTAHSIRSRFAITTLALIVGYLAANLFVEVFYNLQLMSWLWLLIGIATSSAFYPCRPALSNPVSSKAHSC